MGITQNKKHFLLVDKTLSADCIRPVVDNYYSQGFDVVHVADFKQPILTKNNNGKYLRIDPAAKGHGRKVIIVTPEATLWTSSSRSSPNMNEEKQSFSLSKLAKYENEMCNISNESIEAIVCCYPDKWIKSLTFANIIHLLNLHSGIVQRGCFTQPWNRRIFISIIAEAIDEELGSGSSYLLMKTLHHIYKIDEDIILRKPQIFEDTIKRMFGRRSENILNAISRNFTEKVSFNTNINNNYARNREQWAVA
jgi:hypothetical protein